MTFLDVLLGRPLATDEDGEQRMGVATGIPTFGLDALGSAAYGPEAALTILIPVGVIGLGYVLPLTGIIVGLLAIVYFSYRQTIEAYPNGGGSYTVAGQNLGENLGLLAAAALMLDYLLDVGVGISTGVGALVSAVPALVPHTLLLCLGILAVLTVINLRGVTASGTIFMLPTYVFVACLLGMLGLGIWRAAAGGGHPQAVVPPPKALAHTAEAVGAWILIRAFASGCTALTGVEAVSNGVKAFKEPTTRNAQWTLTALVGLLAVFLAGIAYLVKAYGIVATDPGRPGYQSLLSMLVAAVAGKGWFYFVTIGSILVVLSLSANTAFAGFPRLCRIIAEDGYLPRFFAIRGRRLVYTEGILVLAVLSGAILAIFGGVTDRLIPLFAIGAFLAFTLSQLGMVMHWKREGGARSGLYMAINGIGALATGITVCVVLVAKFMQGAWVTVLVVPALLLLMFGVHRHYVRVRGQTEIDDLEIDPPAPPVAVLPVSRWDRTSEGALRFACSIAKDIEVLHIECAGEHNEESSARWQQELEGAARRAGVETPQVTSVPSPYRFITQPIVNHVLKVEKSHEGRMVAVVVPELVSEKWWQYLLHNHRSTALKTLLLMRGNRSIVVVTVPWYLSPAKTDNGSVPVAGKAGK